MTSYYVEVKENGVSKIVPHNAKEKYYKFMEKAKAKKFLSDLQKNNIGTEFRLVKETLTVSRGGWEVRSNE